MKLSESSSDGNGHAIHQREAKPIGLNGQKVVGKRYSLKDMNGEPLSKPGSRHRATLSITTCKYRRDPVMRDYFIDVTELYRTANSFRTRLV